MDHYSLNAHLFTKPYFPLDSIMIHMLSSLNSDRFPCLVVHPDWWIGVHCLFRSGLCCLTSVLISPKELINFFPSENAPQ